MSDTRAKLQEPFEAIQKWMSFERLSQEHLQAVNDSLVADLVGAPPVAVNYVGGPLYASELMYSILNLLSCFYQFEKYEEMIRIYPWRGRVSRSDHLSMVCTSIINETYILEERLKKLFNSAHKAAKELNIQYNHKSGTEALKLFHRAFSNFLKFRGIHVHQGGYEPRDIGRIKLLELLKNLEACKDLLPIAYKQAKQNWLDALADIMSRAEKLIALAFDITKPVWSVIAQQGAIAYSHHSK